MIYLVSVLGTLGLLTGAMWVIAFTLRNRMDAVFGALIGRDIPVVKALPPPTFSARVVRMSDYRTIAGPLREVA